MVVKLMRWRWPPVLAKKYEVKLVVRRLEGWDPRGTCFSDKLTVEIRWKGQKSTLGSLRRTVKRNLTKEVDFSSWTDQSTAVWDEEFQSLCTLSAYKENGFLPWEIAFCLFNGASRGTKIKAPAIGTARLNLAEYASATEQKEFELNLPLLLTSSSTEIRPVLCISLSFLEMTTAIETTLPSREVVSVQYQNSSGEACTNEKDELSAIKVGLRKVKIFKGYVSTMRTKKEGREEGSSDGRCAQSDDGEHNYPFDSDSLEDFEEGESDEVKEDSFIRKSFSYGTLTYANCAGGSTRVNGDEDWFYYGNHKSEEGCVQVDDATPAILDLRRSILPWRKRKLSFRSPKTKGEPLLKKAYGEEGGDDIDFDRRQLSSDEVPSIESHKTDGNSSASRSSFSDFGDGSFAVGSWEPKEVVSRDGHMKLQSQVFFASIDQRSERAAGESACTALVAVIADWFQNNRDLMPIKSQFDNLIREGSLEWRNLCENEIYRERFPDKHFDLETVLEAKLRSSSVVPGKSFIGFFQPEGIDEEQFDFLHGAMSFDNIWDEINSAMECSSSNESQVYIVSWNDHFFILKVESDAHYIVDTLGERLYEGCDQAYILKFDHNTIIHKKKSCDEHIVGASPEPKNQQVDAKEEASASGAIIPKPEESTKSEDEWEVVHQGKDACKEYIKSFLAAIPIRELQDDIKRGLVASVPLHHRLQIEFHYTELSRPLTKSEPAGTTPPLQLATTTATEIAAN